LCQRDLKLHYIKIVGFDTSTFFGRNYYYTNSTKLYAWSAFSCLFRTFVLSLSLGGTSRKKFVSCPINMKKTNDSLFTKSNLYSLNMSKAKTLT